MPSPKSPPAPPEVAAAHAGAGTPASDDTSSDAGELRAEYRQRVDQPPLGHITLQTRTSRQPVRLIRDISAHGVSLLVDEAVAPGEPVLIAQILGDSSSLHNDRTSAQTHAPHAPTVGAEALSESREHVYRAYVVWCRRQAADELRPVPGYLAGLRVFDPHGLGQLVEPPLT